MSPPRGWSKSKELPVEVKPPPKTISIEMPPPPPKEEKGPPTKTVTEEHAHDHAKVLLIWWDGKKEKTKQYTMADLEVMENIEESFGETGRKTTRIHLQLEGNVLEKQ